MFLDLKVSKIQCISYLLHEFYSSSWFNLNQES